MAGRCTECGHYHHSGPPCDNCGAMSFTPAEDVKACAECGAIHRDESPPCNECGSMGFRKVNPDDLDDSHDQDDDGGIPSPSTHSRRTVLYGLGIVGVLGAGYYAISSSDDYPTKEVAGKPDKAAGIRFETVETEVLGLMNDKRASQSQENLSRPENVDAFAEYWCKTRVEEGKDVAHEEFDGDFNVDSYHGFTNRFTYDHGSRIAYYNSADQLAQEVFENLENDEEGNREMTNYEWTKVGIDLHAGPDGDVFYAVVFA